MVTLSLVLAIIVVSLALIFDFTNGFHDAANAIATVVSTRTLPPRVALLLAAVMNLIGALLGTQVAETIAKGIVNFDLVDSDNLSLLIILSALIGAIFWNLATWYFGLPSSSSHALIGGLVGAGLGGMIFLDPVSIKWDSVLNKVIYPMFYSPLCGFIVGYILYFLVRVILRNADANRTYQRFRYLQLVSSSLIALGHGLQDAQKTMGIIFMTAAIVGWCDPTQSIPLWVKLLSAGAISLGTYSGGFRIMKTLGRKIIALNPAQGFCAELTASSILYLTSFVLHAPVSTTHVMTSSIMGVGAVKGRKAVRWSTAESIVGAWVLTLPAAALVGMLSFSILNLFFQF